MSKIKVVNNFHTNDWSFEVEDLNCFYAVLEIGFSDGTSSVEFDSLNFKYELRVDGQLTQSNNFPPKGVKYISTSEKCLVVEKLDLIPQKNYTLQVSSTNAGKTYVGNFEFYTSLPEKPYPEAIWNGETWVPPVDPPDESGVWIWNIQLKRWELSQQTLIEYMNAQSPNQGPLV
jgi:hypothetical protein